MTRDEHRAKCIEEMARAYYASKRRINVKYPAQTWDKLAPQSRNYRLRRMQIAFDSLDGIAIVVTINAAKALAKEGFILILSPGENRRRRSRERA